MKPDQRTYDTGQRWVSMPCRIWNGGETAIEFLYDPAEPLQITLATTNPGEPDPVVWIFGRDLLLHYLDRGWAGDDGDVRFYTDSERPGQAAIHVSSPDGEAWLDVPEVTLRAFASQVKDAAEMWADDDDQRIAADLDAVLHELVGGA